MLCNPNAKSKHAAVKQMLAREKLSLSVAEISQKGVLQNTAIVLGVALA